MFAIVEVGARQYRVEKGDIIEVEKQDSQAGQDIILDRVLLVSVEEKTDIGTPYISGAKVSAKVLAQTKGKKLISYKYRRRKSRDWKKGHRQQLTRLEITKIAH
ncbi:MAG TPA: 50S ribosomal protein L21 [Patescibacteria group bacterium]|nr:50S ribosomal protein L21 [Patescibacteria group bacterium]